MTTMCFHTSVLVALWLRVPAALKYLFSRTLQLPAGHSATPYLASDSLSVQQDTSAALSRQPTRALKLPSASWRKARADSRRIRYLGLHLNTPKSAFTTKCIQHINKIEHSRNSTLRACRLFSLPCYTCPTPSQSVAEVSFHLRPFRISNCLASRQT